MRCEIPEVGRCCFCFPLRLGLIVWGYLKMIASSIVLSMLLITFIDDWDRYQYSSPNILYMILNIISIVSLAADIVFHIIFAVGAHKKDPKKMELFSKFCFYILALYVLGLCYAIFYTAYMNHFFAFFFGFTLGTVCFSCIVIQIYIIILVKSEVMKLKRGSNFEFINHGAPANMNVKIDLDSAVVH